MLVRSARIMRDHYVLYLLLALLIVGWEALIGLELFAEPGHVGEIVACLYLSTGLPFLVLRGMPLSSAAGFTAPGSMAAGFKVVLIAVLLTSVMLYATYRTTALMVFGMYPSLAELLIVAGLLVLTLPLIVTLLGSWIPAGIAGKGAGLHRALLRGVMSLHTVYWRLVLALAAAFVVWCLIVLAHLAAFGWPPMLMTQGGALAPIGLAAGYLIALVGLALLTYVNVVVCVCYARAENIDLDRPPEGTGAA
ncbi:hypothetical protein [Pleomorphomonas sp. JP5]|uniref:hypothetical protein n=1 Tax=Pleomorphomonas sp. JP5 TaxID=2942998 RepID=UPI002042E1DC|nr:hypothetical protein [Pleomorphomonas sp. JP5]MCM5557032.1 hypothetical protein [Pleomorphomonas sp. JP5]